MRKSLEAFIQRAGNRVHVTPRPLGPLIPVPTWLIEWSKTRYLFLSLTEDPWALRLN